MSRHKNNNKSEYYSAEEKQYDEVSVVIAADCDNEKSTVRVDCDVEVIEVDSELDVDIIDVDIDFEADCDVFDCSKINTEGFEDEDTEFDSSTVCRFSSLSKNIEKKSSLNENNDVLNSKFSRKKWSFKEDLVGNSILVLFVIFIVVFIIYLFKVFI